MCVEQHIVYNIVYSSLYCPMQRANKCVEIDYLKQSNSSRNTYILTHVTNCTVDKPFKNKNKNKKTRQWGFYIFGILSISRFHFCVITLNKGGGIFSICIFPKRLPYLSNTYEMSHISTFANISLQIFRLINHSLYRYSYFTNS